MTAEESPAERVRDLLEEIADALDLDGEVEVSERDGVVHGAVEGEDMGLFIGRHGSTIDAVQHLAQRIASHGRDDRVPVVIDAAGYRERRAEVLHRQADRAMTDATRYERPVALDAMVASERKIVHEYLKDRPGIETYSQGDEPNRHLVVAPVAP